MAPKNVIIALLALTSFAYGQTRALFVNTNGTVQWGTTLRFDGPLDFTTNTQAAATRTNLSLGLPALTNTSNAGLLSALGAMTTNGDASGLTNFPALLLTTNSAESAFPAALLRTNGDGSGLTNLPNANLTNATGILPLANGGTGQTNAALAIQALLPSYTGNSNRVLALNSNATSLVWTTNAAGGGASYSNSVDAMLGLFFANTNDNRISMFVNGGTNANNQHIVIGSGASAFGTNVADEAVVIGSVAEATNGGVAIGSPAVTAFGVAVGPNTTAQGRGVALGNYATAFGGGISGTNHGSVSIGSFATATNDGVAIGSVANTDGNGLAIGRSSDAETDTNGLGATAVGFDTLASGRGVAIGANAVAAGEATVAIGPNANGTLASIAIGDAAQVSALVGAQASAIQLGNGTNTNDFTIQIWNSGSVTTNTWNALANSTTIGREIIQAATNGGNGQVLVWTNGDVAWSAVSNTSTDASTLTNFPTLNQNTTGTASNVTGVVAVANGGTGANNASNARVNLLPSYTGNASRVLALNSNATEVVWAVDGGGTPDVSTATGVLPVANGGTGASNALSALTNLSILTTNSGLIISTITTNYPNFSVIVGNGAINANNGAGNTIVGHQATGHDNGAGLGGVALGRSATITNSGIAIGYLANANGGVAIGESARATNGVQIGLGTNATINTIQFRSAGLIDTNEWSYLANASPKGGSRMTNTNGVTVTNTIIGYDGTNYTTNTITVIDGIITSWTQ